MTNVLHIEFSAAKLSVMLVICFVTKTNWFHLFHATLESGTALYKAKFTFLYNK